MGDSLVTVVVVLRYVRVAVEVLDGFILRRLWSSRWLRHWRQICFMVVWFILSLDLSSRGWRVRVDAHRDY